jgi:hypothetical protein
MDTRPTDLTIGGTRKPEGEDPVPFDGRDMNQATIVVNGVETPIYRDGVRIYYLDMRGNKHFVYDPM